MNLGTTLKSVLPSAIFLGGALGVAVATLSGCGGSEPTGTEDPQAAGQAVATSSPQAAGRAEDQVVRVDASGRRWVGKVPLNVFHENPLEITHDSRPVTAAGSEGAGSADAVPPVQTAGSPGATGAAAAATTTKPVAGSANWGDLIAAEVLDIEVKKIINRLNEKLQTVGTYNSSHLELPPHIHTLAVLSEVALEHPGEIRWKDKARPIRDLAAQMAAEKLQQGARSHKALQEPFEQLTILMSGSDPGNLPDGPAERPFADLTEMPYMMRRLEIGSTWLKVNVASGEALMANKEDVLREASVVAALGKVIASEGFGFEDFEDYVGFANDLAEGGRQMVLAAHADNFAEYDKGINRVYKACQECHSTYR